MYDRLFEAFLHVSPTPAAWAVEPEPVWGLPGTSGDFRSFALRLRDHEAFGGFGEVLIRWVIDESGVPFRCGMRGGKGCPFVMANENPSEA